MANLSLKFVQAFVDRHGRARYYYRRPGFKRVALPGLPGSTEFMAAYAEAGETVAPPVGLRQIHPGTINALAVSYFNSARFRKLAPTTQASYRGFTDRLYKEDGDKPVAGLKSKHIFAKRDQLSSPVAANALLKMMRVLMSHAVDTSFREDNPARDVPFISIKSDGHHSLTEEEIAQFERVHPIGSPARLALTSNPISTVNPVDL